MRLILLAQVGFISALFIGLGIPLALRKIRPNRWYGFRLSKIVYKPEIWYSVNEFGGKAMILTAIAMLGLATGISIVPGLSDRTYTILSVSIIAVGVMAILIAGLYKIQGYK